MTKFSKPPFLLTMLPILLLNPISALAALNVAEIDTLLASHNQTRANVLPTAANMTRLQWDANLATIAQNFADQCNFPHNLQASTQYAALSQNTGGVGENIFAGTGLTRTTALSNGYALWGSEARNYNLSTNTCAVGQSCGHYTQIVWANTLRVGCGLTLCPTLTGISFTNAYLLICDYNPAGNFAGQTPYVAGAAGSQCPPGLPNVVGGLCSPAAATTTAIPALSDLAVGLMATILVGLGSYRVAKRDRG